MKVCIWSAPSLARMLPGTRPQLGDMRSLGTGTPGVQGWLYMQGEGLQRGCEAHSDAAPIQAWGYVNNQRASQLIFTIRHRRCVGEKSGGMEQLWAGKFNGGSFCPVWEVLSLF